MFEGASFHVVKPCNMKCKFCYATFNDFKLPGQLPVSEAKEIVFKLAEGGLKKITFAGGEPMLYRQIDELIKFSKRIGLTTKLVTNGSLLDFHWLAVMRPYLDWIQVSIDSLSPITNGRIGRVAKGDLIPDENFYSVLCNSIKRLGYKFGMNTVVCKYNKDEDMSRFVKRMEPLRWKIFQTLPVKGQNDEYIEDLKVTADEFFYFLHRHSSCNFIPEDNELMTGSYLLIDPLGRLFENSSGEHTYSDPLQENTLDHCLSQINLNRETFLKRGGIYEW